MARFFFYEGFSVELILTTGSYRQDWEHLISEGRNLEFVSEQALIANVIGASELSVLTVGRDQLRDLITSISNDFLLFRTRIKSSQSVYDILFNFINICYNKTHRKEFLLNANELTEQLPNNEIFSSDYLVLHCRYNLSWGQERNLTDSEFIEVLELIREKTRKNIVVVSDTVGCEHYRSLLDTDISYGCVFFSKDFTSSFLEDCAIVLHSSYYLQLRGGGMGIIAMFSNTPYLICSSASNEILFAQRSACSWATESQVRYFSDDFNLFRLTLNKINFSGE